MFKKKKLFDFDDLKKTAVEEVECSLGSFTYVSRCEQLFLNIFSDREIFSIFAQTGLLEKLKALGFSNILIDIDRNDQKVHYLRVYYDRIGPDNLLIDLRLSETKYTPGKAVPAIDPELASIEMLVLEWISASNPCGKFTKVRPQLPGQKTPGLGVLSQIFSVLEKIGDQVHKDGYLTVPDHVHSAIMYSKRFRFIDPAREGMIKALMRDLGNYQLADIAWGFTTGSIVENNTGIIQEYAPSEQVFPLGRKLAGYLSSKKYADVQQNAIEKNRYILELEKMVQRRKELLMTKNPVDL